MYIMCIQYDPHLYITHTVVHLYMFLCHSSLNLFVDLKLPLILYYKDYT